MAFKHDVTWCETFTVFKWRRWLSNITRILFYPALSSKQLGKKHTIDIYWDEKQKRISPIPPIISCPGWWMDQMSHGAHRAAGSSLGLEVCHLLYLKYTLHFASSSTLIYLPDVHTIINTLHSTHNIVFLLYFDIQEQLNLTS